MATRYVLKKETPVEEPIQDISIVKMQEIAIERQMRMLKTTGTDISVSKLDKGRFRLRYKNLKFGLYMSQKFTPYISKNGRLVIIKSGDPEIEAKR